VTLKRKRWGEGARASNNIGKAKVVDLTNHSLKWQRGRGRGKRENITQAWGTTVPMIKN